MERDSNKIRPYSSNFGSGGRGFVHTFELSPDTVHKTTTSGGTRTHNPRLRRPVPYPLGHRGLPEMQHTLLVFTQNRKNATFLYIAKILGDTRV